MSMSVKHWKTQCAALNYHLRHPNVKLPGVVAYRQITRLSLIARQFGKNPPCSSQIFQKLKYKLGNMMLEFQQTNDLCISHDQCICFPPRSKDAHMCWSLVDRETFLSSTRHIHNRLRLNNIRAQCMLTRISRGPRKTDGGSMKLLKEQDHKP